MLGRGMQARLAHAPDTSTENACPTVSLAVEPDTPPLLRGSRKRSGTVPLLAACAQLEACLHRAMRALEAAGYTDVELGVVLGGSLAFPQQVLLVQMRGALGAQPAIHDGVPDDVEQRWRARGVLERRLVRFFLEHGDLLGGPARRSRTRVLIRAPPRLRETGWMPRPHWRMGWKEADTDADVHDASSQEPSAAGASEPAEKVWAGDASGPALRPEDIPYDEDEDMVAADVPARAGSPSGAAPTHPMHGTSHTARLVKPGSLLQRRRIVHAKSGHLHPTRRRGPAVHQMRIDCGVSRGVREGAVWYECEHVLCGIAGR